MAGNRIFLIGILALAGLASASAVAQTAAEVRDVRFGVDGDRTRVVVELSESAEFRAFTLAEPSPRLVVDLPAASWTVAGLQTGEGRGHGLFGDFRYFQSGGERARIVFELDGPALVAAQFSLGPAAEGGNHRLVVDVERAEEDSFRAASGFPAHDGMESLIAARAEATFREPERERRIIVIDPGHGGRDPGAVTLNGSREADINLAAALELRRQLEATGRYEVILTRSTDIYVEHEDRVRIAAAARADLFISLHADSAPNPGARGASVYTLNDRGESRARQRALTSGDPLVAEARASAPEVNNILVSLALREKRNQSSVFASALLPHIATVGPVIDASRREANFYVLLDSQAPAVLLEMGYITNREDERNLNSAAYRERLMRAVVTAIGEYFDTRGNGLEGPVRHASLQPAP